MSEQSVVRSSVLPEVTPAIDLLLDASSLNTVLTMLEVIDSVEELALLETLTLAQKRQVWDATPEIIRIRLKQLRSTAEQAGASMTSVPKNSGPSDSSRNLAMTPLLDSSELSQDDWLDQADDLAEIELGPLTESDLTLHHPLNLSAQATVTVGDWIVLQARPQLARAELMAIWEVIEVKGNYARISARGLATRDYPTVWMVIYPQPIDQEPEF